MMMLMMMKKTTNDDDLDYKSTMNQKSKQKKGGLYYPWF